MAEQGRVDLERLGAVYEQERRELARSIPAERVRVIRAQASLDRDCHMVGRGGASGWSPTSR